ncbi:unnamed protein product [Schistosoma turkestanicum]|nr:unnamed protein product [Schistosoma turkestanicum]
MEALDPSRKSGDYGICSAILITISYLFIMITFPFSLFFCIKVVAEYERAVIFRLGRILPKGARGPGLFFIAPCIDSIRKVDLRTVTFDVPPQEVLTKDSVIAAEGEEKSSVALKQAADVIKTSPFALQLRYLQTLSAISAEKNSTIIFPLPIDMLVNLFHR